MQSGLLLEQSFRMSKTDLAARPMFARKRDAIEAHLTIVFTALAVAREAHAAGTLAPGIDPEALANVLLAVLDGLQFQWLLDSSIDMRAGYAALAEVIFAAAGSPSRTAAP